jgi:hypothetical protein
MMEKSIDFDTAREAQHLPLSERVLDKLADMLWASDLILDMLAAGERPDQAELRTLEPGVRHLYEQIDALMRRLAD